MKNLLWFIVLFPNLVIGQNSYTISGKITDAETGEDLIGVTVQVADLLKGTISNSSGFYSLTLPENEYTIIFSYIGYEKEEYNLVFERNTVLNVEILKSVRELGEVVISSERDSKRITSTELGVERINLKDINNIPVIFGEKDILKTMLLLPGISNSSEGRTGFNVRGGSMGQNLILLDDAPVYMSSHLMGFFSVFNSEAIKDVIVYKGGTPANYGGRASSVLDITMNNGNSKYFSSSGGIGLISTRLTLEGPIIRDKMSFMVSGRRTYADMVAKVFSPGEIISNDMNLYFYDLNAKINYTINEKNRLFVSGYFGKDVFDLADDVGTGWGNATGTIRWNHLFSNKLFSKTSLIYSKFDYGFIFGLYGMKLRSGVEDISLKEDFTWYVNPDFNLKFGTNFIYHIFKPGEISINDTIDYEVALREKRAFEGAVYLQGEHRISSRISADYGLRISGFTQVGPGWFYNYNNENEPVDSVWYGSGDVAFPSLAFEPRLSLSFLLSEKSSLKFSYNRMSQYVHLLSNTTTGSPSDVWIPGSNNLKPVFVDQISAGFFRNFLNSSFETSIEAYYKNIINAVDYEDGADVIFNRHGESQLLTGRGRSYGIELFLKKKYGDFTGWVGYTISRTENRIAGINNYSWYPVKYDKVHDASIVLIYNIGKRVTMSGVWTYATGNAVTFPSGSYNLALNTVPYYTERNGYRMPPYHRLDFNLTLKSKGRKKYKSEWDFSVYNLYNRRNAYMITFRESETVQGTTEAVKLSLFGILPSISYNFKF